MSTLDRAKRFLDRVPLVDGHNDLPWVIRHDATAKGEVAAYGLDRLHQETDTDIPRLKAGKVGAQFWAAFVATEAENPTLKTFEQINLIRRMNDLHADVFLPATKASDIARAKKLGKIASFVSVEGGVGLQNSLELLEVFYDLGVRYMTLCHNGTLDWVDSSTGERRHGGLTDFGRDVVRRMNCLGMIVDCAHVSPEAAHHVLDVSVAPILVTHANAFALCPHERNVPDDLLDRIKANGGAVMATFVPDFLNRATLEWHIPILPAIRAAHTSQEMAAIERAHAAKAGPPPRATLAHVCDHIEYMAKRMGVNHVGIGSDFYGGTAPEGLEDVSRFPHLIAALMERGWADEALEKLASANLVRVFRKVEATSRKLKRQKRKVS